MCHSLDLEVNSVPFKPWAENKGAMFSNGNLGYFEEKGEWVLKRQSRTHSKLKAEPFTRLTHSKKKSTKRYNTLASKKGSYNLRMGSLGKCDAIDTFRATNGSQYFPVRIPNLHSVPLWETVPWAYSDKLGCRFCEISSMLAGFPLILLSPEVLLDKVSFKTKNVSN